MHNASQDATLHGPEPIHHGDRSPQSVTPPKAGPHTHPQEGIP